MRRARRRRLRLLGRLRLGSARALVADARLLPGCLEVGASLGGAALLRFTSIESFQTAPCTNEFGPSPASKLGTRPGDARRLLRPRLTSSAPSHGVAAAVVGSPDSTA